LKKATAGDKAPFFSFGNSNKGLSSLTDFAPAWVMWMIALSLGLGTMIGWKRIVVTIGEKIGKQHLSYAQGASAELVASITIGLATAYKWPVSTTHVLSSGIAGSMVASKGIKNLQGGTVKNIVMAWVLTLPVTILLSATLFVFFRWIIG
jgi:PiT family inorganic phosphate transporter